MDRIGFARLFSFESVRKGTLLLDEERICMHVANILLVLRTPDKQTSTAHATESASQRLFSFIREKKFRLLLVLVLLHRTQKDLACEGQAPSINIRRKPHMQAKKKSSNSCSTLTQGCCNVYRNPCESDSR